MGVRRAGRVAGNYFFVAGLAILGCTLVAFSDNLITDVGQPSNRDPTFVVHGLFCFAWVVLLVVQADLVRRRRVGHHRRVGAWAAGIAAGVLLSTWYIQFSRFESWAATPFLSRSNILFITSFGVVVAGGYLNRRRPERHKRLMFLATLYMLGPIVDRVGGNTGISPFITNPVIWNGMFLSFIAYDLASTRRVHPVTYLGYGWFWAVWALSALT